MNNPFVKMMLRRFVMRFINQLILKAMGKSPRRPGRF
ncbi:hypothetical protein Thicy_0734 [Thiomicrospira cyclica ALM1]|jgi:hypothetical protein|uniref:Uncharacterized protein n=1 Tax=Thiomicrospira cyclica (strain DSM 14477 / JCM 11371 / ALM1) TaxID=717773 RepID=F6DCC0_THICA|nr:hypothetical protein Thicy_0734 [Thiomicrospira cyclica ALM1]